MTERETTAKAGDNAQAVSESFHAEEREAETLFSGVVRAYAPVLQILSNNVAALAILVATFGVVVAGYHYAQFGISVTDLPLTKLWSAGVCFLFVTGLMLYAGMTLGFARSRARAVVLALTVLATFQVYVIMRVGFSAGVIVYSALVLSSGFHASRRERANESSALSVPLGDAYLQVASWLYPIFMAGVFGLWVYPSLPRAVGGGQPQPVEVRWESLPPEIPAGAKLAEVFHDDQFFYFSVEVHQPETYWWGRLLETNKSVTRVAVPRSEIAGLTYGTARIPIKP